MAMAQSQSQPLGEMSDHRKEESYLLSFVHILQKFLPSVAHMSTQGLYAKFGRNAILSAWNRRKVGVLRFNGNLVIGPMIVPKEDIDLALIEHRANSTCVLTLGGGPTSTMRKVFAMIMALRECHHCELMKRICDYELSDEERQICAAFVGELAREWRELLFGIRYHRAFFDELGPRLMLDHGGELLGVMKRSITWNYLPSHDLGNASQVCRVVAPTNVTVASRQQGLIHITKVDFDGGQGDGQEADQATTNVTAASNTSADNNAVGNNAKMPIQRPIAKKARLDLAPVAAVGNPEDSDDDDLEIVLEYNANTRLYCVEKANVPQIVRKFENDDEEVDGQEADEVDASDDEDEDNTNDSDQDSEDDDDEVDSDDTSDAADPAEPEASFANNNVSDNRNQMSANGGHPEKKVKIEEAVSDSDGDLDEVEVLYEKTPHRKATAQNKAVLAAQKAEPTNAWNKSPERSLASGSGSEASLLKEMSSADSYKLFKMYAVRAFDEIMTDEMSGIAEKLFVAKVKELATADGHSFNDDHSDGYLQKLDADDVILLLHGDVFRFSKD